MPGTAPPARAIPARVRGRFSFSGGGRDRRSSDRTETVSSREAVVKIAPWLVIPLVAMLLSMGASRQQLGDKEDRSAHELDVVRLQSSNQKSFDSVRTLLQLREVRDSVRDVMLRDLVCDRFPQRQYCGSR